MPKFSVYVQDDLWERAREKDSELNASQLVQAGLRHFVEVESARPAFATKPPTSAPGDLVAIRLRLRKEARQRYELGYQRGVEIAEVLPWTELDTFAECGWDIPKWFERIGDAGDSIKTELSGADWSGDFEPTYWWGITDALRGLWEWVMQTEPSAEAVGVDHPSLQRQEITEDSSER